MRALYFCYFLLYHPCWSCDLCVKPCECCLHRDVQLSFVCSYQASNENCLVTLKPFLHFCSIFLLYWATTSGCFNFGATSMLELQKEDDVHSNDACSFLPYFNPDDLKSSSNFLCSLWMILVFVFYLCLGCPFFCLFVLQCHYDFKFLLLRQYLNYGVSSHLSLNSIQTCFFRQSVRWMICHGGWCWHVKDH